MQVVLVTVAVLLSCGSVIAQSGDCVSPNQQPGLCIDLRSCGSLYALLQRSPLSNNDRYHLQRSQCGWNLRSPLVCCPDALAPVPQPSQPTGEGDDLLPPPGVCGRNPTEENIIGGTETAIDEFPWMALLQYSKPNNKKGFHCGGVLISNRYVLTASHCVNGKDIPTTWQLSHVRLGEWDLTMPEDCVEDEVKNRICSEAPLDIAIEEKIPHESYNPQSRNQQNDIALLRLQQTVPFTDFIIPVCLPRPSHLRSGSVVGTTFSVAGWGKTETVSQSNVKLKVRIDGVSLSSCNGVYSRQGVTLGESQICAGGQKGFDSCRGDSGGPLMAIETNNGNPYWYLAGVVSFGPSPCGQEGWPGVYTRVGTYVDWIESKLRV